MPESPILRAEEIAQLASFDHFRAIRSGDNAKLVRSLAKRGYLDMMYRDLLLLRRDPITRSFLGDLFRHLAWRYWPLRRRERVYRLNAWGESIAGERLLEP